ncbi:MipA/OmpV family protein [Methylobacterium sp. J-059]|uniref:MipA/OmpV family protein n=2 Tax=Methylobacterium TaxID=407 RepID=UPI0016508AA6|nr:MULTISPECIES: MipA/OmpV family protein [unclassified Methylobacterium]MCJ2042596.1 MipA/OmpV family protein [Methylobacterium sp. J-059]MCJ2078224.1 MipA/OmpV family protein [Methylobacterium sp. E-016]
MGAIDETGARARATRAAAVRAPAVAALFLAAPALAVLALAVLASAALDPAPARAGDLSALFDPGTVVSVGGFAGAGGRFQGARAAGLWGLPYASFRKADERPDWFSPDDALDAALVDERAVQAGAVLDVRSGRAAHDDRSLAGLPRRPVAAGLGLFGAVWPVEDVLRLRAEVTQGLRAHDGLVAKLGADLVGTAGRVTLSGGPRLVLGDAAAMRLDFDVPVAAIADPRLTPYRAAGGPRSVGAIVALAYAWSEAWQTIGSVRYDRLVAAAAGSPIVRRLGTPNDVTVGFGAIYSVRIDP